MNSDVSQSIWFTKEILFQRQFQSVLKIQSNHFILKRKKASTSSVGYLYYRCSICLHTAYLFGIMNQSMKCPKCASRNFPMRPAHVSRSLWHFNCFGTRRIYLTLFNFLYDELQCTHVCLISFCFCFLFQSKTNDGKWVI